MLMQSARPLGELEDTSSVERISQHILEKLAEYLGDRNCNIHVKIDTGMHRLGFEAKDLPALLHKLPQVEGGSGQLYLKPEAARVFSSAEETAQAPAAAAPARTPGRFRPGRSTAS